MEKAKINVNERFIEYLSMYGNEELIPLLDQRSRLKMGQVSVAMNSMVHSQNLFSSIVTAIRDVEEGKGRETVLERRKNKADGAYKPGTSNSKMTSSRQIPIQNRN
jgi:hypothetical protein